MVETAIHGHISWCGTYFMMINHRTYHISGVNWILGRRPPLWDDCHGVNSKTISPLNMYSSSGESISCSSLAFGCKTSLTTRLGRLGKINAKCCIGKRGQWSRPHRSWKQARGRLTFYSSKRENISRHERHTQTWHAMVFISLERSTDWDFHPIKESHTHTHTLWHTPWYW